MAPVRGHRSHIAFTCVAAGVQAHSSTGRGRNANWDLIPFLMEMKSVFERLRDDTTLQDADYDPPFSDFNVVIDNHGAAVNVTVPEGHGTDQVPLFGEGRSDAGIAGGVCRGEPLRHSGDRGARRLSARASDRSSPRSSCASRKSASLPAPRRTAPMPPNCRRSRHAWCSGPGDIAEAHTPTEKVRVAELVAAVPILTRLAICLADT